MRIIRRSELRISEGKKEDEEDSKRQELSYKTSDSDNFKITAFSRNKWISILFKLLQFPIEKEYAWILFTKTNNFYPKPGRNNAERIIQTNLTYKYLCKNPK